MSNVKTSRSAKRTRTHRTRLAGALPPSSNGTREKILAGAREVLLRHGYERFTIRRVADSAGITVGNLTYHFPSKRQLLLSLIQRLLAEYTSAFEGFFADLSIPMDRKFTELIEWLMNDAATLESNRLFRELWVLAMHDRFLASAIDDFYDKAIGRIAQLLRAERPAMTQESANAIAHLVALISEGTGIIYGTRPARVASHADVKSLAVDVLTGAAESAAGERTRR
jgi:AcrR family transcriptional regulator